MTKPFTPSKLVKTEVNWFSTAKQMTMYAVRLPRFTHGGESHTGRPDGMFIREDGLATDHKQNAALFDTEELADAAIQGIRNLGVSLPMFVVEVIAKPVMHRQARIVSLDIKLDDACAPASEQ